MLLPREGLAIPTGGPEGPTMADLAGHVSQAIIGAGTLLCDGDCALRDGDEGMLCSPEGDGERTTAVETVCIAGGGETARPDDCSTTLGNTGGDGERRRGMRVLLECGTAWHTKCCGGGPEQYGGFNWCTCRGGAPGKAAPNAEERVGEFTPTSNDTFGDGDRTFLAVVTRGCKGLTSTRSWEVAATRGPFNPGDAPRGKLLGNGPALQGTEGWHGGQVNRGSCDEEKLSVDTVSA